MSGLYAETVLLVTSNDAIARVMLNKLFDQGFHVVGPAATTSLALALAAQSAPSVALVAGGPGERRGALDLARELMRTWGVHSLIVDEAGDDGEDDSGAPDWAAQASPTARLWQALRS